MRKRIFAFLMALLMMFSAVPTQAFAAVRSIGKGESLLSQLNAEENTLTLESAGEAEPAQISEEESDAAAEEAEKLQGEGSVSDEAVNAPPGQGGNGGNGSGGGYGDTYGTDLGWEYAIITDKSGGGYNLQDPQSNSSYGTYYGDKVHVTFGSTNVAEGYAGIQDEVLVSGSETIIEITCDYGYYISAIVLACAHSDGGGRPGQSSSSEGDPFQCNTAASDNAYALAEPGSTLNDVKIEMGSIYTWAHHLSSVDDYFLMIQIAPLPDTLYVGYDSGSAGGVDISARPVVETGTLADGGVQNASFPTWGYTKGTTAPQHTVLGISPEAVAEAAAIGDGYAFAGWKLEYYTVYTVSSNEFSSIAKVGSGYEQKGDIVSVDLHAKLTAVWQPLQKIQVTKVWEDANNQDGLRPESIQIHLLQNGSHYGDPVTLDASNNWTATWTVPQLDVNGYDITYAVEETVPNGYTCIVSGSEAEGFVLTNTHNPETVVVNVQKVWNDDNNRDGIRPDSVTVQLVKNGTPVEGSEVTLVESNTWTYQWSGLEKYQPKTDPTAAAVENVYTVQEIGTAAGYTVDIVPGDSVNLVEVVNTHAPSVIDIPVEKVWDDADNQDGVRPDAVTVTLFANGDSTGKTLTLNEDNNWKGVFEDIYENYNGVAIGYSVEESEVAGYTVKITGSAANGFTITNSYTPEKTSISFTKVWNDANDQDGIRPDEITVTLYADGEAVSTMTVDASDNWAGTFENLPVYKVGSEGVAISYTVGEANVPDGYSAAVDGTIITNNHTPDVKDLSVTKVWGDNNNQDGKRPYAVVISLYANGRDTGKSVILRGLDSNLPETAVWEAMPVNQNGQRISYSTVEIGILMTEEDYQAYIAGDTSKLNEKVSESGYTVTHKYDYEKGEAVVTNTYTPLTTFLNVQKSWADNNDQDGIRPAEITVTLYRKVGDDGQWESTGKTKTMTAESGWLDVTFTGLPMYESGKAITYNVVETEITGYTAEYDYDPVTGIAVITNTHTPEKTSVSVTKVWNDADDQDGKRPESNLTVELFADGVSTGKTAELVYAAGKWSAASFANLDKYAGGREIVYTIEETSSIDGYTASYEEKVTTQADGTTITEIVVTNTHDTEKIEIPVTKSWNDENNQDGLRPTEITVTLYKGETEVASQTLTAANSWKYTFEGLDKYENGALIDYTVEESAVTGYSSTVVENADGSVTITNTHIPETTYVTATKVWDDNNNQDGKRPASIELYLLKSGEHVGDPKVVTPDTDGNWPTVTWENLPKYSSGTLINYTVTEKAVGGYSVEYDEETKTDANGKEYVVATVTNSYTPAITSVSVVKQWNDADDQDGIRPAEITVELYADGVATGKTLTLKKETGWVGTFHNLDKMKAGALIAYTVEEIAVSGYEGEYSEGTAGELVISNTHTPEKTSVSVTKVWNDADDQDGKRPDAATITLFANGETTGKTLTLNEGNGWKGTFENLDKNANGKAIVYTVEETEVAGYTTAITGTAAAGFTVTNSHTPETISVPVTKIWDDENNQDGKRPDSITVELYADGTKVREMTLSKTTNWVDSFDNLPKYSDGELIKYTIGEPVVPEGYDSSVDGNTITNTYTPETVSVTINKFWNDNNNQDGKRPYAVQLTLYANAKAIETLDLGDGNPVPESGSWLNLPRYQNGEKISYTIQETGYYANKADYEAGKLTGITASGYTPSREYDHPDSAHPVVNITNTYTPEATTVNIQKVWDDKDNQDGIRPESITIELYANGNATGKTAVLSPSNEWDVSFQNLPKYQNGDEIVYTVVEEAVEGYTSSVAPIDGNGVIVITNTHEPATTEVSVNKVWNDDDNQDGKRPASVTVTLYADGIPTDKTLTLTESNGWKGSFKDLAKYYHGSAIRYSVEEVAIDGYTAGYGRNTEGTELTVTNKHTSEVIEIPVTKKWVDGNNQDGIRPATITVTVYKGTTEVATYELSASENWHHTFKGLDKYEDGKLINYTVKEIDITGYAGEVVKNDDGSVTITNTHTPETVKVTATKVWDDNDDQDGVRPASITLHLLASGKHTEKTVVLKPDEDGNWPVATWEDLPKYSGGTEIVYTVTESDMLDENGKPVVDEDGKSLYSVQYHNESVEDGVAATITNTYKPGKTAVTVEKLWSDNYDQDNKRPDSITVELYADGAATGNTLELTAAGGWIGTFTDLDLKKDGVEIAYTVAEVTKLDGYDVSYDKDSTTGDLEVINTRTSFDTVDVPVEKHWEDGDNRDGKRPTKITVTLVANGKTTDQTLELTAADGWKGIFKDLDKNANGKPIVYTVEEAVVEGYTSDVTVSGGTVIVTNTYTPATISIPVTKTWVDGENQDGIRPSEITITLLANGTEVASRKLTASGNWRCTFAGLNKYENGEEIVYTVEESAITGYTAEIVEENGTIKITNTHKPETANLKVTKVWDDNDNQDGKRPYAVQITLYANGTATDKTLVLGNGINALAVTGSWKNMPRYHSGQRISYSVVETGYYQTEADYQAGKLTEGTVPGYGIDHEYDFANASATVINTYTPETTNLRVYKKWDDDDNQDGIRPAKITVTLYANGVSTGETQTLTASSDWQDVEFPNLPKCADGKEIVYSVVETAIEGYEVSYEVDNNGAITVTNTHKSAKTEVSVTKIWDDNNNQDNKRPEQVIVKLLADGKETGKVLLLTAARNWIGTFRDLDKYKNGEEIVYTVSETAVDGYTASVSEINADGMITITNTHIPEKINIPVTKIWDDENNRDGIRPDSITITVYKGEIAVATYDLSAAENWHHTFSDLDKFEDGKVIEYTVKETAIVGYTSNIVNKTNGIVEITNTHTPDTISVVAVKVWDDNNNQDGKRPDSITLHLLANGKHMEMPKTVTQDADGNWTVEWTGLKKYAGGIAINYTVMEESVEGYSVEYIEEVKTGNDGKDYIEAKIRNSYTPEKTSVTVEKIWNDNYNQDGKRPEQVIVRLLADGEETGKVLLLTAARNWIGTFRNLDLMKDGKEISYTVEESRVEGYTPAYSTDPYTGNLEITNTYTPETTGAVVTKFWNDANDQDGIRPYAVVMALYADGQPEGSVVTLNAENGWTGILMDLPRYDNGVEVEYSFVETGYYMTEGSKLISGVPAGYTAVYDWDGNSVIVTNTHIPETVSVPVTKTWNDNNNQDGIRPESITVALYADGQEVATKELRASTNWTDAFTNLPKYSEGEEINYELKECDVPEGYTSRVEGNEIINTYEPEKVNLNVSKVWGDNNNQDGKRPYAVVVTLFINGHATEYTATLSPDNGWTASWKEMDKYHNGQRISYTVVETGYYQTKADVASGNLTNGVPEGYTVTHSYDVTTDPQNPTAIITNTYTPMTVALNVQKEWDDDDNRDGIRPASITVTLLRKVGTDGAWESTGKTAVLSPANEWDADFVGLPKYENGQEITYNVVEKAAEGYEEPEYEYNSELGVVIITNTHKAEKTELSVHKVWNDNDDQDGIRPAGIVVQMYTNGQPALDKNGDYVYAVLSEENDWSYTWTDLYKFYHGAEIRYAAVEVSYVDDAGNTHNGIPAGYTAAYGRATVIKDGKKVTEVTVNNKHIPETISIPVYKKWNDGDNQDGIRPESITVTVSNGDTVVATYKLTAADNWHHTFTGLDKFENGVLIDYKVEETAITGYTGAVVKKSNGTVEITNTHEVEKTELTAVKIWNDNNDQDGERPDSITVHLLANGVETGKSVDITAAMNWTYTWTNLDKYAAGKEIRYTVYEEPVLLKSAQAAAEGEDSGNVARVLDRYVATYVRNPDDFTEITILNTYTPKTTVVTAMKVWDDGDNRDGLRPESITVELIVDGVKSGKTKILNEANGWIDSWTDLPMYRDGGVEIQYRVEETADLSGYTAQIKREEEYAPGLFIITNKHNPAVTGVAVSKVWQDEDNIEGLRLSGIVVQLYANGTPVEGAVAVLSANNRWTHIWTKVNDVPLYVNEQGKLITYTVMEIGYVDVDGEQHITDELPNGYIPSYETDGYNVTITNTRAAEKTDISTQKKWVDDEDNDGIRPYAVEVTLMNGGVAVDSEILSEANNWTASWNDLYVYASGQAIVYKVEETGYFATKSDYEAYLDGEEDKKLPGVPEGYVCEEGTKANGYVVTNTHEIEIWETEITKIWKDNNDGSKYRPDSIDVQLYKNGEAYGDPIELNEENDWEVTVKLPVFENGEKILWTVKEVKIPTYYTVSYDQDTLTITNTIKTDDTPKTGDDSNIWMWSGLLGVSGIGAALLLILGKKKKNGKYA